MSKRVRCPEPGIIGVCELLIIYPGDHSKIIKGIPKLEGCPFAEILSLDYSDIRSCRAFLTLLDVEGYPVTFAQAFETG